MPLNRLRRHAVIVFVVASFHPDVARSSVDSPASDGFFLGAETYRRAFPDGPARDFESAVWQGSVDTALEISEHLPLGVNTIGTDGHTALEIAAYRHDAPMVKALLKAGARPNGAPDRAPLAISLHDGQSSSFATVAKLLVDAGADVDGTYDGSRAIDNACLDGNPAVIEMLIGWHTNLNANPDGTAPPVITVAQDGQWSLVQLLLRHGASMWGMDMNGYTLGNLAKLDSDPAELALALGPHSSPDILSKQTQALDLTVRHLKQAGYPWPAPEPQAAKKLKASGHWPPAGADVGEIK